MSNLKGKLPFVGSIYADGRLKIIVTERERVVNGPVIIHFQYEHGRRDVILAENFYEKFKRMKDGTRFVVQEGWNE